MDYKIADIKDPFNAEIVKQLGNSEYLVKINDNERNLKILNMSARGIEFILDQKYHKVKYLDNTTSQMKIVVDGVPITLNMHNNLNEIVFKNSGESGIGNSQLNLYSQIPGTVVQISISVEYEFQHGDVICVLES